MGFSGGTHDESGTLWTGSFGATNEDFPLDHCPTLSTSLSSGAIGLGSQVTDVAALAWATGVPNPVSGYVTYFWSPYSGCLTCGSHQIGSPVNVGADGSVPQSSPFQPTSTGAYCLYATYDDPGGYNGYNTSPCEKLMVYPSYYLTMQGPGAWRISPPSGYYWGTVTINASGSCDQANPPYHGTIFRSWTGQGSGSYTGYSRVAVVTMNSAITETASFNNGLCPQRPGH